MLNVSALLSASAAVGWNVYCAPTTTLVAGVPEITARGSAARLP